MQRKSKNYVFTRYGLPGKDLFFIEEFVRIVSIFIPGSGSDHFTHFRSRDFLRSPPGNKYIGSSASYEYPVNVSLDPVSIIFSAGSNFDRTASNYAVKSFFN